MTSPFAATRRIVILVHRWMGVALALLLTVWCVSGIVMLYRGYPEITDADRLARLPRLDAGRITIPAAEAARTANWNGPPAEVRLLTLDGRPAWELGMGRDAIVVFADDGTRRGAITDADADRAAASWAGRSATEARRLPVTAPDQWTLLGGLRSVRPLHRYVWPDGQHVYVDGSTGQVVQHTTSASRAWAYAGAIPHWLYFTPLRVRTSLWSQVVIWTSAAGTLATLLGLVAVAMVFSWGRRYRVAGEPRRLPYRGWTRWHAIGGAVVGALVVTWAFSGLLSMGPFETLDRMTGKREAASQTQQRRRELLAALAGPGEPSLESYTRAPAEALAALGGFQAVRLELGWFDGHPHYRAIDGAGRIRVLTMDGPVRDTLGEEDVLRLVRGGLQASVTDLRVQREFDAYYVDRRGERPLPVVRVTLAGTGNPRFYVDPRTGRIAGAYHEAQWIERWLYQGLHSWNLPWLYAHRPLWDVLIITALAGATALCVTSLVLAWRVLGRSLR